MKKKMGAWRKASQYFYIINLQIFFRSQSKKITSKENYQTASI